MAQFFKVLNKTSVIITLSTFELGYLDLRQSGITSDTAVSVLQSLDHIINLSELNLSENKQLAEFGGHTQALGDAFKKLLELSQKLNVLDVHGGTLNDTTAESIAQGLRKSISLKQIDVSDNLLSDTATASIVTAAHVSLHCIQVKLCNHFAIFCVTEHNQCYWNLVKLKNQGGGYAIHELYSNLASVKKEVYRAVENVLPVLHLSFLPITQKSFQFKMRNYNRATLVSILQSLKQLCLSFNTQEESGSLMGTSEVVTKIHLTDSESCIYGSDAKCALSFVCMPNFELNMVRRIRWEANVFVHAISDCAQMNVMFKADCVSGFLNFFGSLEQCIMKNIISYCQLEDSLPPMNESAIPTNHEIMKNAFMEKTVPNVIRLSSCRIPDTAIEAIAPELKNSNVLNELILEQVDISANSVHNILKSLEHNVSVKRVFITVSSKHLTEDESKLVGRAVERMLHVNSTLKTLSMFVNTVIAKAISNELCNNITLQELLLHFDYHLHSFNDDAIGVSSLSDDAALAILCSASSSNLLRLEMPASQACLSRACPQSVWNVEFSNAAANIVLSYLISQSSINVQKLVTVLKVPYNEGRVVKSLNLNLAELHLTVCDPIIYSTTDSSSEAEGEAIQMMLEKSTTLQVLHLMCQSQFLMESLHKYIALGLSKNNSIKELTLHSWTVSYKILNNILKSLQWNSSVENLNMQVALKLKNESESLSHTIASLLNANSTIKVLLLPHFDFSEVITILEALHHNTTLVELSISWKDVIDAGQSKCIGHAIEEMLKKNVTLKSLDLTHACTIDNIIMRCIADGLMKNISLNQLTLNSHLLSDRNSLDANAMAHLLSSVSLSNLKYLHFHPCIFSREINLKLSCVPTCYAKCIWDVVCAEGCHTLPPKFISALGDSTMLVSMKRCKLGLEFITSFWPSINTMMKYLHTILEHNCSLEELAISCGSCTEEYDSDCVTMEHAVEGLIIENTTIKVLKVSDSSLFQINPLQTVIVKAVSGHLSKNGPLRTLDLSDSCITAVQVVGILKSVEYSTNLKVLYLSGNPQLLDDGEEFGVACRSMLTSNTTVEELHVRQLQSTTYYGPSSVSSNVIAYIFKGVCENTSLKKLDVTGTSLGNKCIETLIDMLAQNCTLTELNVSLAQDWYFRFDHILLLRALLHNTTLILLRVDIYHSHDVDPIRLLEEEMEGLRRIEKPNSYNSKLTIAKYVTN